MGVHGSHDVHTHRQEHGCYPCKLFTFRCDVCNSTASCVSDKSACYRTHCKKCVKNDSFLWRQNVLGVLQACVRGTCTKRSRQEVLLEAAGTSPCPPTHSDAKECKKVQLCYPENARNGAFMRRRFDEKLYADPQDKVCQNYCIHCDCYCCVPIWNHGNDRCGEKLREHGRTSCPV